MRGSHSTVSGTSVMTASTAIAIRMNGAASRTITISGCFVMFGGWVGGEVNAATGLYRQELNETVTIVPFVRVLDDPTGAKGSDELTPMIETLVRGLCGWGPAGALGVFQLISAELTGFKKSGGVMGQIDIGLNDQLRITT